jgi:hypothetical protein
MRVDRPDGTSVVVPFYTDIFSPDVDFISQFRYLENYDGDPTSGEPYTFTLLDALDNPIPGTSQTDVWTGCLTNPPRSLAANVLGNLDIDLSWTPVAEVPGFDPADGVGFYQICIGPWDFEGGTTYGANGIASPTHIIPWNGFGGWAPGFPDGYDNGSALSELEDGNYELLVEAFSQPDPANPGRGHECAVKDYAENLYFNKMGESITFFTPGP